MVSVHKVGSVHEQYFSGVRSLCIHHYVIIFVLFILYMVSLAMLYIGTTNINQCPINKFIPIFLIISAIATIFILTLFLIFLYRTDLNQLAFMFIISYVNMAIFVWCVIGAIVIYPLYEPNYDKEMETFCDQITYLSAFWYITADLVIELVTFLSCGILLYLLSKV